VGLFGALNLSIAAHARLTANSQWVPLERREVSGFIEAFARRAPPKA
jgi:hypothetical protein